MLFVFKLIANSTSNSGWLTMVILFPILAFIIGGIISWYFAMRFFKKQIKDNPPINEKQIRYLYNQIGRKPSEKQIKQIMRQFENN